jgi:predicted esterase
LESLSDASAPHYAYYDIEVSSLTTALDQLEAYVAAYGPFDAVLGFSQGAGLAAMLLVRHRYRFPTAPPSFKCAVFFSPVSVYDPVAYAEHGEKIVLSGKVNGRHPIDIPTMIAYGKDDSRRDECQGLIQVCDPDLLEVLVHSGHHEIPGVGRRGELVEVVKLMRRVVCNAEILNNNNNNNNNVS